MSKSAFVEEGGSFSVQISDRRGRRRSTTVNVRKLECLVFCVVSKYPQCIVWFCHKACVWHTDRQTDRITTPKTTSLHRLLTTVLNSL